MKKLYFYIFIIVLFVQIDVINAQTQTVIRGRIVDQSTGEPIPGVNVVEMDDQNRIIKGVITDINGNYILEVSDSENSIQVSFVGYHTQQFKINNRSRINIELEPKTLGLEEVVVTADFEGNTLTGVSDRDKTGSSVKVDMDRLSGIAGASSASALQGQVSGLDIVSASGAPGSGSSIVIRGMGSIGNTNPLIVVDGIPQDIKTDDFNFAAADEHDLGQLLSIAPQDIESVEVLKDAASTAVWGSKGANGVLVIETSKGTKGKIQFNYQYKLSANYEPPPIPMLNGDEYITLQLEEWHNNEGIYDIPSEIAYDRNYVDFYNYSANTNWIDEITRNSFTNDHFFKMQGGGRKSRYYTSINHQKEFGTTTNTSFERLSVRVNFDYNISDRLRFTTNFTYTNTYRENNPRSLRKKNDEWWNLRQIAYVKAPNMSIWEHDEDDNLTGEYFNPIENYQGNNFVYLNPIAVSNLSKNDVQGNLIQNNFIINYNIFDWLKIKESISFSYVNDKGKRFIPSSALGADWLSGEMNRAVERNSLNNRLLSRSQVFISPFTGNKNHSMTSMLMWEMEEKQNEYMQEDTRNGPSIFIKDPSVDAPVGSIKSDNSHTRLFGALASLNYKYKDRYIFSSNLRADGSSIFGVNNQWGIFPSLSMGWRFSEEFFMKSLNFLGESKLRLGWGQSGIGVKGDPYATFAYYETTNQYMEESGITPEQIQLANLKWQTVTSWNAGVDINLFDDRIFVTADVYDKISRDLLWEDYGIPESSGYTQLGWFNGGELQNTGWEFFMRGTILDNEDFNFSLNFNTSQNINTFLSFPENFKKDRGSAIGNGIYPRKAEAGKPIGSFYGFKYLGVYPTDEHATARDENGEILLDGNGKPIPMSYQETYEFKGGDAIYEDVNHDGRIDILDVVYIGDSSPEFIGGFGANASYKQFSASIHFHYRLGFDIINQVAINTEGMLNRDNQSKAVLHRWKLQGDDEDDIIPRAYLNHPANNLGSDRYVEAGDFMRLNSLSLNYRLKPEIAERFRLSNLNMSLMVRNVFTITNYSGQDPEIGRVGRDPFFLGRDNAQTPPPRVFSLAFNFVF